MSERVRMAMETILRQHPWDVAQMTEDSPVRFEGGDGLGQARAVLSLFEPGDTVWCGGVKHSIAREDDREAPPAQWNEGPERWRQWRGVVAARFRKAMDWMDCVDLMELGPRICGCVFKPGVASRSLETVARERFFVIEHDKVGLDAQASLLRDDSQ